jgi:hypothetical protein
MLADGIAPYLIPPAAVAAPFPSDATLDLLAKCESGNDPTADTGNGYLGMYQWDGRSWSYVMAGTPYAAASPNLEPASVQSYAVRRYVGLELAAGRGGFGPWPSCAAQLGLPR